MTTLCLDPSLPVFVGPGGEVSLVTGSVVPVSGGVDVAVAAVLATVTLPVAVDRVMLEIGNFALSQSSTKPGRGTKQRQSGEN